jgi:hypothetical protein
MMQFITLNLALFASFLKMHFSLISLYRADATLSVVEPWQAHNLTIATSKSHSE